MSAHEYATRRFWIAIVWTAIALSLVGSAEGREAFVDLRRIAPVEGDAAAGKAKAITCVGCHGPAGIAPVAQFPNLAGQKREYLYWRLDDYRRRALPDSPMPAQVAPLSDQDMRNIATYYGGLSPNAPATAASDNAARGEAVFRTGDASRGVPPCVGCHGVGATGHPLAKSETRYDAYPSLRGQHLDYIVARLKDFRDGTHHDTSNAFVMQGVAHGLDDPSIDAVARYLAGLGTPP